MKKAALHNLGCKVNAYETEAMQELLEQAGYQIVPFEEQADVYIINTCTVTNVADRKSRQMLHRARKKNPGCGDRGRGLLCADQGRSGRKLDADIDIVIGNNKKKEIARVLEDYFRERGQLGSKRRSNGWISAMTSEYEDLAREPHGGITPGSSIKGPGRLQSVLFLLYHPLCQRPGAQPEAGKRWWRRYAAWQSGDIRKWCSPVSI